MITETGQIAVVSDDAVWVDCSRRSNCQRCAEGRGCGGAIVGRMLGEQQYRIKVSCQHERPVVGQPVSMSVDESVVLRATVVAYLLPLIGLMLGALAGHLMAGDSFSIAGGAVGFVVALLLSRLLARRFFTGLLPTARLR